MSKQIARASLVVLALLLTACPKGKNTGTLVISVSGLPSGVSASVLVTSQGYSQALTASDTVVIPANIYLVTASSVTSAGTTYMPKVSGSPALVLDNGTATVTVFYAPTVTPPSTGSLQLIINGLPNGTNASVTISGPAGYSSTATAAETLSGLTPGAYTISAANVVSGSTYVATVTGSPATVTAGNTSTVTITYAVPAPTTGSLQVNVSGLPSGTSASVTINGPASYSSTATATETLSELAPGSYTISAANVVSGSTYVATISGSPATITAGATTTVTVVYAVPAPTTGSLQVNISGLPSGTSASVTISGPASYSSTATASETLSGLAPGSYTISAANVTSGSTYVATISGSPANITAGNTSTVTVVYAVPVPTTGSLQVNVSGLPSGTSASVTVSGPASYSSTATATETVSGLAPGSYTISAANVTSGSTYVATISGSPATITAGNTTTVTVVYAVPVPTTGSLQVNVSGLPSGASASVTISGPASYSSTATATETLSGLAPGSYTISGANVVSGSTYVATISGSPANITAGNTSTVTVVYAVPVPTTGSLQVNVSGLPSGTSASVTVSGPASYSSTATATETVSGLAPGSYTISAANVTSGSTYVATISGSPATITAGNTTTVTIVYAVPVPTTGSLQVNVSGLPSGASASVTISGPASYSSTATATETLSGLAPGSYTISAANVLSGSTYVATISGSPAAITAGNTSTVTIVYAAVPTTGSLQVNVSGLPSGTSASVTISGPASYSSTATATETLSGLAPGSYIISAANVVSGSTYVATVSGSPATITAGATTTVTVVYEVVAAPGSLQVNITGSEFQSGAVTVSGPNGYTDSITAVNTTLTGLAPGTYTVSAPNILDSGTTYGATITGSPATVTSGNTSTVTVNYTQLTGTANVVVTFPGGAAGTGTTYFTNVFLLQNGSGSHVNGYNSNTKLNLGSYTILANPVTISGIVYTATVTTSPFTITANTTTLVTVDYEFPAPTIISVIQNYAFAGQYTIAINGTGFASDGHTVANIDGVPCTGVTVTPNTGEQQLQCTVPTPHAPGFVSVTVTTSEGTTAVSPAFQYEYWSVDYYSLNQTLGDQAPVGGMVIGPDSNVWFTDMLFGKVGTVDGSGNVTECLLPTLTTNALPEDIASGADGNLWVTDEANDVIYSISPISFTTGNCVFTSYVVPIPTVSPPQKLGGHPWGITSGPDGNIWFTQLSIVNGTFDQIGTINVTTGVMTEFALTSQGSSIWGITSGPGNQLWFAVYPGTGVNAVGTISTSGMLGSITGSTGQNWLTTGPDGNIWYTSVQGELGMITANGIVTGQEQIVGFGGSNRITSDARGAVWYSSGALSRFDTTLLKQRSYPVGATSGVAVAPTGEIWSLCVKPPAVGQSAGQNSICRLHI